MSKSSRSLPRPPTSSSSSRGYLPDKSRRQLAMKLSISLSSSPSPRSFARSPYTKFSRLSLSCANQRECRKRQPGQGNRHTETRANKQTNSYLKFFLLKVWDERLEGKTEMVSKSWKSWDTAVKLQQQAWTRQILITFNVNIFHNLSQICVTLFHRELPTKVDQFLTIADEAGSGH